MSLERLDQQVDAFVARKRLLVRGILRCRHWLESNRLASPAQQASLERALQSLRNAQITLAFVGEFSRGKTELINALFFAHCGQRMLPSRAGRTTMCPTELFFDPHAPNAYLRLLPIETRLTDASVAQLKRSADGWLTQSLDSADPQSMARAFAQVARVKPLPVAQAMRLGFQAELLEPAGATGQVWVPVWRHALVNLDHPLLRKGLRVLDTPGLNALGCEPELGLSMLPHAEAVLFILAADAGVTASDLAIWQQHIGAFDGDRPQRLFAILNKIDALWDDLAGPARIAADIARIRQHTATRLGLPRASVLPLSAKQALLARVRGDAALFERSQLVQLEKLLGHIVAHQEHLLAHRVADQVLGLLGNGQQLLRQRLDKVELQQRLLAEDEGGKGRLFRELGAQARAEHRRHYLRLGDLRTHQGLLQRQGEQLRAACDAQRLDEHLQRVRRHLGKRLTTLGINQAIVDFFSALDADLDQLDREAERANRMVAALYARQRREEAQCALQAPLLQLAPYRQQLRRVQGQADLFRLQLKTLLSGQRSLARRFLATLAQEVVELHRQVRDAVELWLAEALLPLLEHHRERKRLLEQHLLELRALSQDSQTSRLRGLILARYATRLAAELAQADVLRHALQFTRHKPNRSAEESAPLAVDRSG